jgi:hypothetical protein
MSLKSRLDESISKIPKKGANSFDILKFLDINSWDENLNSPVECVCVCVCVCV